MDRYNQLFWRKRLRKGAEIYTTSDPGEKRKLRRTELPKWRTVCRPQRLIRQILGLERLSRRRFTLIIARDDKNVQRSFRIQA